MQGADAQELMGRPATADIYPPPRKQSTNGNRATNHRRPRTPPRTLPPSSNLAAVVSKLLPRFLPPRTGSGLPLSAPVHQAASPSSRGPAPLPPRIGRTLPHSVPNLAGVSSPASIPLWLLYRVYRARFSPRSLADSLASPTSPPWRRRWEDPSLSQSPVLLSRG